jgi:hypothetical protein
VDETGSEKQREALVQFARAMAGPLLDDLVWVKSAPVQMDASMKTEAAFVRAGAFAEVRTRPLNHHDMHCGNETVYYPPLTEVEQARPAYALANRFEAEGLGTTWSWAGKRSAFIGTFSR